jgi:hypothetical protein
MENDQIPDPYEVVLADLRSKKEHIEATIALLESLRAGGVPVPGSSLTSRLQAKPKEPATDIGPGAFFGMTIHDAAISLLKKHHREMQTTELVPLLEQGGIRLTSIDKTNTVGSILLRRFYTVGDLVRVSRGRWGLQEWYPGRKFPKGTSDDNANKGDEQQENAVGNEGGTLPHVFAPRPNPHAEQLGTNIGSDIESSAHDDPEDI